MYWQGFDFAHRPIRFFADSKLEWVCCLCTYYFEIFYPNLVFLLPLASFRIASILVDKSVTVSHRCYYFYSDRIRVVLPATVQSSSLLFLEHSSFVATFSAIVRGKH